VTRLPHAAHKRALIRLCTLLLGGMALSPSLFVYSLLGSSRAGQSGASRPHSVDLKWKASVSRVVGYNVYRSETDGGPFLKLTSAPVRVTNFTDRNVQSGHIYFYAVTAVDSKGKESGYSNQIKAPIPSP
jgi:fibronectin type 3 domain-containing protein